MDGIDSLIGEQALAIACPHCGTQTFQIHYRRETAARYWRANPYLVCDGCETAWPWPTSGRGSGQGDQALGRGRDDGTHLVSTAGGSQGQVVKLKTDRKAYMRAYMAKRRRRAEGKA